MFFMLVLFLGQSSGCSKGRSFSSSLLVGEINHKIDTYGELRQKIETDGELGQKIDKDGELNQKIDRRQLSVAEHRTSLEAPALIGSGITITQYISNVIGWIIAGFGWAAVRNAPLSIDYTLLLDQFSDFNFALQNIAISFIFFLLNSLIWIVVALTTSAVKPLLTAAKDDVAKEEENNPYNVYSNIAKASNLYAERTDVASLPPEVLTSMDEVWNGTNTGRFLIINTLILISGLLLAQVAPLAQPILDGILTTLYI